MEHKGINDQQFPQEISNLVRTKVNIGTILAPRIKIPVPNVVLQEDDPLFNLYLSPYEYDFQDYGIDLNWYVTGKNVSLYILSGEYSDNDIINIVPLPDAYGNNLVTLWLMDSDGYTANQPLWINITPVNDNPIFSNPPDLIVHYDDPYTFNYESYLHDIDTPKDKLQLFTRENVGGLVSLETTENADQDLKKETKDSQVQVNGFKVTYNFPESYVGKQVFVSLIIFDGDGTDGDTIQINVTDDYTPKLTKELPDIVLQEGETKFNVFDLDDYFEDPDKDSLFYSFGETHVTVIIRDDHMVDVSLISNWYGIDTITFRARDPIGALAEDTIFVIVIPVNDPPVIAGVPDTFVVHYDTDYSFDLIPYITDDDNSFDDLFLILTDVHIRTDPSNPLKIIMNYPKAMVGMEIPVTLTVSDGLATDAQTVTVKVSNNWPPEIIKELPDVSFYEDDDLINAFHLDDYFSDKDSKTLYYSYGQQSVNVTIHSNSSVDFFTLSDWHGVEIVTFRAADPTLAFVENVITVTVIPINDPPIIRSIPNQKVNLKQIWKIDLSDFIVDVDNNITELEITVESNKLDLLLSGRQLVIYSEKPVFDVVKITVSDCIAETSETMLIEIVGEEAKQSTFIDFIMSILWLIIFVIIIVISLMGFAAWRKFVGDYEVEEVYWIYNTGILLSHATSKLLLNHADKDIVSGMLTAIFDFTQEAFSGDMKKKRAWQIKEIQMNEKIILVEKGNYTLLATVFSGRSGRRLYTQSSAVLQSMEGKYNKALKSWKGDVQKLSGSKRILNSMFSSAIRSKSSSKR